MAEKGALLPAYLIVGPDELKRKQAVARLRARVDGPLAAFNLEELVASGDMDPVEVLASLNTLPMGGDRRVVVIESAEKLPKAVSEAIVDYLSSPNESCTLALVAGTLAKSTRLYKAVAGVGSRSVVDCSAKKGRDLPPYVQKLAQAHGVSITADAARELVARVGESTTMLDTQLGSLAALLGGSGTISAEFVEASVARVAEVKPWEFLDVLSARDVRRALSLHRLLDGSALGLLSLVTGRLRALALRARGRRGGRPRAREAGLAGEEPRALGAPLRRRRARGASRRVRRGRARPQERRRGGGHHGAAHHPHLRRVTSFSIVSLLLHPY
ncbi:MAG: DNA polymerase III subunit delta [Atopobiaceae bacterium]|nr:DNA polymerase III subunit delta [Atopobiaceae bacterium]